MWKTLVNKIYSFISGTSSQQEININSSIALNVTDINHKIKDLERQLSSISKHCTSLNCSEQEPLSTNSKHCTCNCNAPTCCSQTAQELLQSNLCPSDDDYITIDTFTEQAQRKDSLTTTTYLYEPSLERGNQRHPHESQIHLHESQRHLLESQRHPHESQRYPHESQRYPHESQRHPDENQRHPHESCVPISRHTISKTKNSIPDNFAPELREPYQAKVRKKNNKVDNTMITPSRTVGDSEVKLHEHRTRSALDTGTPACVEPACPLTPPPTAPKGPRGRRSHSDRIEPLPPGDDTYTRKHKGTTKQHRSSSLQGHSKKKNTTSNDNNHQRSSKAESLYHQPRVDRDFIEDLVKKQYLTTKIIGGRRSNMSQFSEPVCRDRDYSARLTDDLYNYSPYENYEPYEQYEPYTPYTPYAPYAVDPPPPPPLRHRCHESRSLPTRRTRSRPCCTHYNYYNDSDLYDMVPVREKKRSPKQRRKYVNYEIYREVPPSPRTLRPKLNLEAQLHTDYDDYVNSRQHKASTPVLKHRKEQREYLDSDETEATFELKTRRATKLLKPAKVQTCLPVPDTQSTPPISSRLQYRNSEIETSHGTNVNTEDASRKTDKTLCEIKDILQNFLEEIKTETFQADKSNEAKVTNTGSHTSRNTRNMTSVPTATEAMPCAHEAPHVNRPPSFIPDVNRSQLFMGGMGHPLPGPMRPMPAPSSPLSQMPCAKCPQPPACSLDAPSMMMPNRSPFNAFNTCTVAHCSVPTNFPPSNSCCYPAMPHCSSGYANPNCSNEQNAHASSSHDIHPGYTSSNAAMCQHCCVKKVSSNEMERSAETEELIKEIHKFVTLNPMKNWDKQKPASQVTSRSVGSSHRAPAPASRHDVTVGTSAMRCYSKSCEAIGSRMITETSHTTRSDTMIERLSLDISQSDSEFPEMYVKRDEQVKKKKNFTSVLKSMFKKKKSREALETTPTTDETYHMRRNYENAPFRQELTTYMMTGQEFDKPPPSPRAARRAGSVPPPGHQFHPPHYRAPSPPPAPRLPHHPRPHYLSTPSSSTYTPHDLHGQVIPEYDPQYPQYPGPYYEHYDRSAVSYHQPPYTDHRRFSSHSQYAEHGPAPGHNQGAGPGQYQDPRLYLREVEVKSTGTQSATERKIPFLQKLNRRMSPPPPRQPPRPDPYMQQHYPNPPAPPPQTAPPQQPNKLLSKWKQFQEKVQTDINNDPEAFGLRADSKLLQQNKNIRKDMLKKMFHKRNPFSPNNLIIRTLLGNDPSSFGVPQGTMRPRLLL